jgi:hypothetical protein
MKKLLEVLLVCLGCIGTAQATYIEYKFTVATPFIHGTESIGGASEPVEMLFRIDADAPNSNPLSTNANYDLGGFASVDVGGAIDSYSGGSINIQDAPNNDTFLAASSGVFNGPLINGRSLFLSHASLSDLTGMMFNGLNLPSTNDFSSYTNFGLFRLGFRANQDDPEYNNGGYVYFDVFPVSTNDFTLTVTTVPEPSTILLMLAASLGLVVTRFRPK